MLIREGYKECQGWWDAVLHSIAREAFTKRGLFQQRLEGGEGVSHVDFWGKSFPGRISAREQSLKQVCLSSCRWSAGEGNGNVVRGTV